MKQVEFISADFISDVLANPSRICTDLGITKHALLDAISSFLPQAQYEQDIIAEYGCGTGLYLSSIATKQENLTDISALSTYLTGVTTFSPRNTQKVEAPLVTVIMPTIFRDPALLDRALKSVLAQSYQNWRVIVVGDGIMPLDIPFSPEINAAILAGHIFITRTGHPGVYPKSGMERWHVAGRDAVNFAIAITNTPIIARLDDDDYWLPEHLSLIVQAYEQSDGNALIYTQPCHANEQQVFTENVSWKMLSETNVMFTCCASYCGTVINDMFYDKETHEPGDWRLYKKLLSAGHTFIKLPQVTSHHSPESHQDGRI